MKGFTPGLSQEHAGRAAVPEAASAIDASSDMDGSDACFGVSCAGSCRGASEASSGCQECMNPKQRSIIQAPSVGGVAPVRNVTFPCNPRPAAVFWALSAQCEAPLDWLLPCFTETCP